MINSFKDLVVWQKSILLTKEIYNITKAFPQEELYNLTSQMRRSAVSIPSNIAEGYQRKSRKEYLQFLGIARGSAAELETQLIIAKENFSNLRNKIERVEGVLQEIQKMLFVLSEKLSPKP